MVVPGAWADPVELERRRPQEMQPRMVAMAPEPTGRLDQVRPATVAWPVAMQPEAQHQDRKLSLLMVPADRAGAAVPSRVEAQLVTPEMALASNPQLPAELQPAAIPIAPA